MLLGISIDKQLCILQELVCGVTIYHRIYEDNRPISDEEFFDYAINLQKQFFFCIKMLLKLEEHVKYYVVMEILMIKQIQCGQKSVTMVIQ